MSLYGDYIKERLNKEIVEDERGFATYYYLADGVYIEDLFVAPDHRHENIASDYADRIAKLAKDKGYSKMYGSVVPSAKHSTSSLKVLLAYGFQLESSAINMIVMSKVI